MPNSGTSSASTYTTKMKLTDEGRPFAKDMFDLFAALIIQMQLSDHRTFFKSYPSSFTTDEASHCLKALKFTHVVKTADPANNGYQFTRTTTTFSMGKEMTKPLLQQFIQARLIINAAEPTNKIVKDKSIYYITSKGKYMIQDFSERAHVSIQHMDQHLSTITSTHIVPLERISETDHLTFDRSNITACFKIMMTKIPLERILADDVGGLKHHHSPEEYAHTFYGYQCFEWISQFTSIVNKEEADMICGELVLYGWIAHILDKSDLSNNYYDDSILFRTSRNALYHVTERGRIVLGWAEVSTNKSIASNGSGNFDGSSAHSFHHNQKTNFYGLSPSHHDYYNRPSSISNSETDVLTSTSEDVTAQLIRLRHILQDPLLRMYFRIYLKDNFCDENINFWLDYFAMRKKKKAQHTKNGLKDMLTDCYAIYDTYLKINAPMEVNIDHALKYQIQQLVQSTFSVVSDQRTKATPFSSPAIAPPSNALLSTTTISVNSTSLSQCLNELMGLYDKVNDHLCRMMAQDSVPRFLRLEKYQTFFASHLPPINNNNNENNNNNNNNNKNNKNNNNKNNNNSNGSSSTSSSSEEGSIGNDTIITEEKSSTLLDSDNTTSQVTQLSIGINSLTCNGD